MKNSTLIILGKFILASLLFVPNLAFAQVDPVGDFNKHVVGYWKGDFVRLFQYRVKGSPYLLGESFPGSITYKGGRTVNDGKVLYDIYNQQAGVDVNNQILELEIPVESFSLSVPEKFGGKTYLFKNPYVFGKPEMKGYLNVVEDGKKLALLKVYKTRLSPDPGDMMNKDIKIFEQYFEFYIYNKATQNLSAIKLRKKDISKEIGDEAFLKDYLSSNNNDLSNEANVIQLIKSFNAN
jgi:hypothetical protein